MRLKKRNSLADTIHQGEMHTYANSNCFLAYTENLNKMKIYYGDWLWNYEIIVIVFVSIELN